jgi:uncharacterized protein (DUF1330 family)
MVLPALALLAVSSAHAADRCAPGDPAVDMVIVSVVQDLSRYQNYRSELARSGLIDAYGGAVLAVGTKLNAEPEMLEGSWPADRHAFVIRWPCRAAAKAFWESEKYQKELLPLRDGSGQFDVALYPAVK